MFAKSNNKRAKPVRARLNLAGNPAGPESGEARAHELSVFRAPVGQQHKLWAATRLGDNLIEGTVVAVIAPNDGDFFGGEAAELTGEGPLRPASHRAPASAIARDLVGELREISGQVNRMMSQVDRAIHRLGVHAGKPLSR